MCVLARAQNASTKKEVERNKDNNNKNYNEIILVINNSQQTDYITFNIQFFLGFSVPFFSRACEILYSFIYLFIYVRMYEYVFFLILLIVYIYCCSANEHKNILMTGRFINEELPCDHFMCSDLPLFNGQQYNWPREYRDVILILGRMSEHIYIYTSWNTSACVCVCVRKCVYIVNAQLISLNRFNWNKMIKSLDF